MSSIRSMARPGTRLQDAGGDERCEAGSRRRLRAERIARNLGQHDDVFLLHRHQLGERLRKGHHHLRLAGRHGAPAGFSTSEGQAVGGARERERRRLQPAGRAGKQRGCSDPLCWLRFSAGGTGGFASLDWPAGKAARGCNGRLSPAAGPAGLGCGRQAALGRG